MPQTRTRAVSYHDSVRLTAIVLAVLEWAAVTPTPQTARALTRAVTAYVQQYQRDFVTLVADEVTTQEVRNRGLVTDRRTTTGELFSTFLDGPGVWMSIHEVREVDGLPVPADEDVRSLLQSASLARLGPRVAAANARFNIGHVTRNFNEPTFALLLFTPARVGDLSVDLDHVEPTARDDSRVTLRVRARGDTPLIHSLSGRVSTTGTVVVDAGTGRVEHTSMTFSDGVVDAWLDTGYAFDDHVQAWVPVTFTERYTARKTGEVTLVRTALTNYRRFETSGRIVP
jgi:hypothetical protein